MLLDMKLKTVIFFLLVLPTIWESKSGASKFDIEG